MLKSSNLLKINSNLFILKRYYCFIKWCVSVSCPCSSTARDAMKETNEDISPDESVIRILSEYRVSLFAEARRYCDDVGDAEELVLRTMDAALREWASCRSKDRPLSWLLGILRNIRAMDVRRMVERNTRSVDPDILEANENLISNETDDTILKNSDNDVVRAAISRLAPEYRKTIVMHYMMGMPLKEIAKVLNRPIGTVKWRLSVAKSVLADRLRRYLGSPGAWLALAIGFLVGCVTTVVTMRMPKPHRESGGGLSFNTPKVHEIVVRRATGDVKIDGKLDEWGEPVFKAACNPPYDRDYNVSMRMMWDGKRLYIAGDVRTPDPMRNNTEAIDGYRFAGGSVICRLSTDPSLGWPVPEKALPGADAPPPDEKVVSLVLYCDRRSGRELLCVHKNIHGHQEFDFPRNAWQGAYLKHADGRGFVFEYAIEWALVGIIPPKIGEVRANTWNIHFSDAAGEACSGQIIENVSKNIPASYRDVPPRGYYQYPSIWGKAVFE